MTKSATGSPSTTSSEIDEFIFSGSPHLEEAYRVGEGVIPEPRRRGLLVSEERQPMQV